ncbi:hypothetical protein SK128_003290, partial [Halocaridina rubra]
MSFRRHYGTGSYSSSLLSSPLSGSYGSRGLGGYSSYSSSPSSYYSSYGSYGSGYSSYGGYGSKSTLSRSASLPREIRDRSVPRYTSSYSRGTSPARSTISSLSSSSALRSDFDSSDSSTSSGDSTNAQIRRSHTFSSGYTRNGLSATLLPRPYTSSKSFVRSSRSKSLGSDSSVSSGYGSNSG